MSAWTFCIWRSIPAMSGSAGRNARLTLESRMSSWRGGSSGMSDQGSSEAMEQDAGGDLFHHSMITVDVPPEMIVGFDAAMPPRLKTRTVPLPIGIPIELVAAPPNGQKNTVSVD